MKKIAMIIAAMAILSANTAGAKDIRVVEISTGSGMRSSYDSSIQSILGTLAGVTKIVSDVTNLVLTVTYDADKIGVDDIVSHINKKEPRFEAKQKSEPKTKKWVKAEKKRDEADRKVEAERQEANQRDQERQQQGQGGQKPSENNQQGGNQQGGKR